jgi:hypothetical protein
VSTNAGPAPVLLPPHGLDQIVTTFGDIFAHIRADHTLDPGWETEALARVTLPFAMRLSWDKSRSVTQFTCHRLLAAKFEKVFAQIHTEGLQSAITTFGGCFAFRQQRTGSKLSAHAWGIALDLNPESNAQGTAGNMDERIIAFFREAGFTWGGDWKGRTRDPMHFQFCSGY